MAEQAEELTRRQRAEQAAIGAALLLALRPEWDAITPLALTGPAGVRLWLERVLPIIFRYRTRSSASAAAYLTELRRVEVGTTVGFRTVLADQVDRQQLVTSLVVTGPKRLQTTAKRLEQMPTLDDRQRAKRLAAAADQAFATSTAAAQRHVTNGGRETAIATTAADRRALGWIRVGDGNSCWFCAMLISRGVVYKEQSFDRSDPRFTGPGDYKVHDFDGCTLKPVYRRDDPAVAASDRLSDLWASSTTGTSGKGSMQAFKAAYTAR